MLPLGAGPIKLSRTKITVEPSIIFADFHAVVNDTVGAVTAWVHEVSTEKDGVHHLRVHLALNGVVPPLPLASTRGARK